MLDEIKGIGPKTIKALNKLNIYTINDLVTYYPYRYNVYKESKELIENEQIEITGVIESLPKVVYIKRTLNRLSFNFNAHNKLLKVVIFNRAFIKPNLIPGKQITLIGKYTEKTNTLMASDIKINPILKETIEPVYHLNSELKRSNFIKIVSAALNSKLAINNYIPNYYNEKYNFMNKYTAIKEIHFPTSNNDIKKSKVSLVYEELFNFMLKINYLKLQNRDKEKSIIKQYDSSKLNHFIKELPFTLTQDQVNVVEDIEKDFNSVKRMNRLILGDVGSGKTIVSFIALYINYLSGYDGILMAPTEILSKQHYQNALKIFEHTNIKIEIITSSTKKTDRAKLIEKLNNNEIDILIGTHSVLNDELSFNNLGLVITDEQHRFGVNQRKYLEQKGQNVDVIYMSATPIPRTLALTIYGDMDISEIKSKPSNRKDIKTKIVKQKDIKDVLYEMLEEIKQNHQIYIVAPLIEDENNTELETVTELYNKIDSAFNHKVPIAVLHGKLKSNEKEQIMKDYKEGKTIILISTTVIEVGVDVKNATMMVIFNAERFGLATLHQLRGRIGRNDLESKCILISDSETERLKVLEESNNGFYISEKDFELRGTGDLFGIRQSGEMSFKIASLKNDYKILLQAKTDSLEFLQKHLKEISKYPNQKEILDSISFID